MSKLYVTPLSGAVTEIVPVGVAHVGCVTETVGAFGTVNAALITEGVAADAQRLTLSFTKT